MKKPTAIFIEYNAKADSIELISGSINVFICIFKLCHELQKFVKVKFKYKYTAVSCTCV